MPKERKAADSAAKKSTRTKKPVGAETEAMPGTESKSTSNMEEQIQHRAYQIYLERGGTGGTAEEDWLQAEAEIRGKRSA